MTADPTVPMTTRTDRARAVLRDVIRSGGTDVWSHLHSHGHHWSTVQSCLRRGWLIEVWTYRYQITDGGRTAA